MTTHPPQSLESGWWETRSLLCLALLLVGSTKTSKKNCTVQQWLKHSIQLAQVSISKLYYDYYYLTFLLAIDSPLNKLDHMLSINDWVDYVHLSMQATIGVH